MCRLLFITLTTVLFGCQDNSTGWHLLLHHDAQGTAIEGKTENIVQAVREGCQLRIAWGARRARDPSQTIEHISEPDWVSIRNGTDVQIQLNEFLINHAVLGEPEDEHPRREPFGGTTQTVLWKAQLKPDGSFDAIWYSPQSGELVARRPQTHEMRWFADCRPSSNTKPLFPEKRSQ